MKGKEKFCMYAKKAMVPVLAIAMVLTATLLPIGAGSSDMYAYADDEATITLTLEEGSVDSLNDTFCLAVNLDAIPTDGISAVQFELDYPSDVFELVKAEDLKLMGKDGESTGFSGEEDSDPYYIAFGSMDEEKAGVYTGKLGSLAQFSFKPKAGVAVVAGTEYPFELTNVKVYRLTATDGSVETTEVTVSGNDDDLECSYTPVADNHKNDPTVDSKSDSVTITVEKPTASGGTPTTEIPVVKTSTVRTAIEQASESSTVTLDASDSDNGSDSIALTKTAAAEIATAGKSMTVKTQASDLTFDQTATKSIGADENGGEKLVIETSKDTTSTENALKYTVTAKLVAVNDATDNGKEVKYFGGGEVEVSLDLPSTWTAEERSALKCWNYTDTNYTEVKGGKVVEVTNGTEKSYKYEFTTNHFSHYMVASENTFNSFKGSRTEGVEVSGTITSYGSADEDITVELIKSGETEASYSKTVSGNTAAYKFDGVGAGNYTLKISKKGHAPLEKTITVANGDMKEMKETIYLWGDVDLSGVVDVSDLQTLCNVLVGNETLTGYAETLADVESDSNIDVSDLQTLCNVLVGNETLD